MKPIPEQDWKAFKRISQRALDRFARRTLADCRRILDAGDMEAVDQMNALSELLRREGKRLWRLEQHHSRSSALLGLIQFHALDLLDEDDLSSLTPETRASIQETGLRAESEP